MSSIRKNIWDLDNHYDLTNSGQNSYYDPSGPYELWAFGNAYHGRLGLNDTVFRSSPIQIPGTSWTNVDGSYMATIATKSDGTLWSWGFNDYGAFGDAMPRSSPTQLPGTDWSEIKGGMYANLATKTDGTLWAWGNNSFGELGQNSQMLYSSPIQILGTQWTKIAGARQGSAALKTDGTLWTWGSNTWGELGININWGATNCTSSPVQVPGTQWNSLCHSYFNMKATKTDGTLWSWGKNAYGRMGVNDIINRSSPTQIPGTDWSKLPKSQSYNDYAFKTDGTLWYLGGYSWAGRDGQNQDQPAPAANIFYSSPVQVPGTDWVEMSSNYYSMVARKTDGTAWTWGYNNDGPLGQNDRVNRSSPTQIPGTQWYGLGVVGYTNSTTFLLKS